MLIRIDDIEIDGDIQLSARGIDAHTVQDYVEALTNGAEFPAVKLFRDNDGTLRLADGFHRVQACRFLGLTEIDAEVVLGTRQDAMIYAAVANVAHGKPMSHKEKLEAGERLLSMTDWSNAEIARYLAVGESSVRRWLDSILSSPNGEDRLRKRLVNLRKVHRGNQEYWMDVSKIGLEPSITFSEYETVLFELAYGNCVYLCRFGDLYKIGRTNNLRNRVVAFRTSNPSVELLHAIPTKDPIKLEKELHATFSEFHVDGEWYRLPESALNYFFSLCPVTISQHNGSTTYLMHTRNIGRRPEPEPELELPEPGKSPVIACGEDDILKRAREIKNERREQQRQARAEAKSIPPDLPDATERYQLICADLSDVTLEPESVDVIVTDPPYAEQYVPLYGALAQLAARVLKPGGSLLAMAGQSYLPGVMVQITPHLRYHWMVSYQTPGGQSPQIWPRRVNSFWKPVLWFVKGDYTGDWVGDVCRSAVNDNDKRFHEWGQSESGLADLLERFTYPGDVVLDPFVGGGTTAVVAVRLGRRFIGVDVDPLAIETTKARLMELAA